MKKVAVVGCGVSGLSCAWGLVEGSADVQISLFEKNKYLGGHTNTVDLEHKVRPKNSSIGLKQLREKKSVLIPGLLCIIP